jgi:molybdate transport system permease protein
MRLANSYAKGNRPLVLLLPAGLLFAFLFLPLLGLLFGMSSEDVGRAFASPLVGQALALSLATTLVSLLVILLLGTPLAWLLARAHGRLARGIETLVELPIVVPPAVAGVALLLAFGRQSPLAGWLLPEGGSLALTTTAVVLAQIFVAAPLYVLSAKTALREVDDDLVLVARSFGASPLTVFLRVAVPLARPGLIAGALLAWARALGEFGATLMFAGNLQGRTQTLPLAIYTALEADLGTARVLSALLVGMAFSLLLAVRAWTARGASGADRRRA